ncbi:MAG: hypothetical protein NUV74_05585 [Candidatus Brocadiaceae bacterium]|nr:hypothetical protein [Candidatus Brocadiaceae bacterium]
MAQATLCLLRRVIMNDTSIKFEPFHKETASTVDRIAWALCQIIDDDAPMRWTRYRFAAECIARNPELMADLKEIGRQLTNPAR